MSSEGLFRIHLKEIPQGDFQETYLLDNAFLSARDRFEIFGGEIRILLRGTRTGDIFDVLFEVEGEVRTLCTRCEDDLLYPLEGSFPMVIKLGQEDGGDDDQEIVVARTNPTLSLDDLLYSFVALSLPLRRTHPEGECRGEIDSFLRRQEQEETSNPFLSLLDDPHFASEDEDNKG